MVLFKLLLLRLKLNLKLDNKKVHILGKIPAPNKQNAVDLGVVLCLEHDIKLDDDN